MLAGLCDRLVVVVESQFVCEHPRIIERNHQGSGRTVYDWRHYLAVLQRKPGALRNGAPFSELPDAFKRLQALLLKQPGGDREMVEVLALVLRHDEQAVLAAFELALEDGAPRKTRIINVLHRLIDGTPEHEPIHSPQALALIVEPQASVVRHDQLRQLRQALPFVDNQRDPRYLTTLRKFCEIAGINTVQRHAVERRGLHAGHAPLQIRVVHAGDDDYRLSLQIIDHCHHRMCGIGHSTSSQGGESCGVQIEFCPSGRGTLRMVVPLSGKEKPARLPMAGKRKPPGGGLFGKLIEQFI